MEPGSEVVVTEVFRSSRMLNILEFVEFAKGMDLEYKKTKFTGNTKVFCSNA